MYSKKTIIIISILSATITGIVCSFVVYSLMSQTLEIKSSFYGTYHLNIRNIDEAEYLAVIPPLSDENEGKFQWYNIDEEMINQGVYKSDKKNYIIFNVDENNISMIFMNNGKYYFIDNSLEPQEIVKISEEPMVSIPLEK